MKKYLLAAVAIAIVGLSFMACGDRNGTDVLSQEDRRILKSDSIVRAASFSIDRLIFYYDRQRGAVLLDSLNGIIDSLQKQGDLSEIAAEELRGEIYNYVGLNTEDVYNRILAHSKPKGVEQWYYKAAGNFLAYNLYMRHNYEGFLRVAVPLIAWMDSLENNSEWEMLTRQVPMLTAGDVHSSWGQRMNLYSLLGCCYLKLEQPDKAKEVLEKFDRAGLQALAEDSTRIAPIFVNTYARVKDAYVRVKNWEEVRFWLERTHTMVRNYVQHNPSPSIAHIYDGYSHLDKAIWLWSLGERDSAAAEYTKFTNADVFNTLNARIQANDYLVNAERWEEAAENYQYLDYFVEKPFMEEISAYYMPKLRANYYAGRQDSALQVAMQIAELFDSAYVWQKRSQMAEMATIYDTQGKEMQIARQQAELSYERWMGTLAAMVLLSIFFVVYIWYRRRVQSRLEAAHTKLQQAYDQLEETTTAKERIESELRIARDIQMSMVPNIFPEREGLDMYAFMTPAKEVGGDLYGYVLQGDSLYFCVGDVSGKGVPASLFMAQSARLFRTLATEGMKPADIATRMNDELSEGNNRSMFVTMFIGLLHLDTGRLDFCNCGHNPPILDAAFMEIKHINQMLGFMEGTPFCGETIDDIRGHQLLIYTDGLTEAENKEKELLGEDRLLQLMETADRLSPRQVIEMLKEAVENHRAGADPNDDLTLMCLGLD